MFSRCPCEADKKPSVFVLIVVTKEIVRRDVRTEIIQRKNISLAQSAGAGDKPKLGDIFPIIPSV